MTAWSKKSPVLRSQKIYMVLDTKELIEAQVVENSIRIIPRG